MGREKPNTNLELIDLYSSLLSEIWTKVSELMAEGLLVFLIRLTIDRTSDKFPMLRGIRVSEAGVSLETMKKQCRDASPEDIHRACQGLVKDLFNAFTAIAENVINRELFSTVLPKLREAEKMIAR